ncbi:MAG: sigma-70 family RNA polymerase sigma factor [Rhizobacter sp.]
MWSGLGVCFSLQTSPARSQLRNEVWAEDAVSETMLAAVSKSDAFAGRSQLKSWLVGILKYKVIDQLRRHTKEACVLSVDDSEDLEELLFQDDGHWREMPADWGCGMVLLEKRQFIEVLERCQELLPPVQARVFLMRHWLELDAEEICKELMITSTNLWVLLHRARLRLRECLENNWFNNGEKQARGDSGTNLSGGGALAV